MRILACLALLLSACAALRTGGRPGAGPGPAPVPGPPVHAGADADFQTALRLFSGEDHQAARQALEDFVGRHPGHSQRPIAGTLLARLALARGDAAGAKVLLETHAGGADEAALAFLSGVIESRLGEPRRALGLLQPFAPEGPPPLPGAPEPDADLWLRAGLAEALAGSGDIARALDEWDRYLRLPAVREHERAYARARAQELGARLDAPASLQALTATSAPLARATLGPRAAAALRARGDARAAAQLEEEVRALRRDVGFEGAPPWLGPGDPTRFGLLVPLSGRLQVLGEVALRGAAVAIGEPVGGGEVPPLQVLVRDTAADGGRGAQGIAELVREEAVIGIVGRAQANAFAQATRDGVPFLALDDQAPGRETTAFQLVHSPEARVAALAQRALALGARTFAILGPDNPGGRRLAEAFRRGLAEGGRITAEAYYPTGATAFTTAVSRIRRANFQGVFVADDAQKLELVAPALAVADLWPRDWTSGKPPASADKVRAILLLSPATALSPHLLARAGRYVQGALLSPGFFAAHDDPRSAGFVARFRQLYGEDPSASDAYSYDGVRLLRTSVERGVRTRADLLRHLENESFEGATGTLRFGADHGRSDLPTVYVVEGDGIRPLP